MYRKLGTYVSDDKEYIELLEHIIDNCWTGILIANNEGEYVFSNKRYKDVTGVCEDIMFQVTANELEENMMIDSVSTTKLVLEEKKEFVMNQTVSSSNKNLLVKGIPFFDQNNDIKFVISNLIDISNITETQKEVERAKTKKKQPYEAFIKVAEQVEDDKEEIIYKSCAMARIMEQVSMVANTDATVFIRGESGTGKELIAKRLHTGSYRKDKPFIKVNCSAIPETLLESEFFGYESGTFTGGNAKGKKGILEYANRGTLLLDEIGDMPLSLQAKLLRVLQEKEFTRLGGHKPMKIDIRFIAATNADVEQLVKEKKLREDLYYRLNIIPIRVPSLNERKEDIPLIAYHVVEKINQKYGMKKRMNPEFIQVLYQKDFPGNVRQLQNLIERCMLLSPNEELVKGDMEILYSSENNNLPFELKFDFGEKSLSSMIEEYEKFILAEYKKRCKSSYKIADLLKVNQSTIFRKMKKYGLED